MRKLYNIKLLNEDASLNCYGGITVVIRATFTTSTGSL
jgi:hypothetical protein